MKDSIKNACLIVLSICAIFVLANTGIAQSEDPDKPTALTNGQIEGSNSTNLQDDKTYYFAFNVKPGSLNLVVDMIPAKNTAGGTLEWHYLDSKFKRMKSDVYSAQGSSVRKVDDAKITVKRKVILKIVVGGQLNYKLKFSGSGFVQ